MLEQIERDLKQAMLAGDKLKVSVLRGLKSALENARIAKRADLDEKDIIKVIKTAAKQRLEAIEMYKKGGAGDKAKREQAELEILESYLPEQMSEAEVEGLVQQVITELGAQSVKDMGRVIGESIKRADGKADGSLVSQVAKRLLST